MLKQISAAAAVMEVGPHSSNKSWAGQTYLHRLSKTMPPQSKQRDREASKAPWTTFALFPAWPSLQINIHSSSGPTCVENEQSTLVRIILEAVKGLLHCWHPCCLEEGYSGYCSGLVESCKSIKASDDVSAAQGLTAHDT